MKRRAGYVLVCGGAILAVASYALRFPANIAVNGHGGDVFTISAALGLVLAVFGIVLIRRAAR
jgi:hypothetical protein